MQLYLLRHAAAEPQSITRKDADRRLTQSGVASLRETLQRARASGLQPSVIVSSPYLRAVETARIAAEELAYPDDLLQSPALRPESSPADLWEEVRTLAPAEAALLVGHEPLLSATVSWMLGETRVVVSFAPATLVWIDIETLGPRPQGVFRWKLDAAF